MIENFNTVAREARGEFFRWIGADDWLEPDYTSICISALDTHREAIVATSGFDLVDPDGGTIGREYAGEFLESQHPRRRLARLLWFFHAGLGVYEPNYSLIRREALLASGLLQIHRQCDWLFSTQLCLMGRFVHVPKRLFHRGWSTPDRATLARLASRLHPVPQPALEPSILRLYLGLARVVARRESPDRGGARLPGDGAAFQRGRARQAGENRVSDAFGVPSASPGHRFTRPSGSSR